MTSFTLQREKRPGKPSFDVKNKGKAVLSLTTYLCKFVMIVKVSQWASGATFV